jgi:hypothetical protein
MDSLQNIVDSAMSSAMPPRLAAMVDQALALGATPAEVLIRCEAQTGRGLVYDLVKTYLRQKRKEAQTGHK